MSKRALIILTFGRLITQEVEKINLEMNSSMIKMGLAPLLLQTFMEHHGNTIMNSTLGLEKMRTFAVELMD